jgi:hypothetical protein
MFRKNTLTIHLKQFLQLLVFLLLVTGGNLRAQGKWIKEIPWISLADGLQYAELDAPEKSVVNDSKLTMLKIDVRKFDFEFLTASEHGKKLRTAEEWAGEFD